MPAFEVNAKMIIAHVEVRSMIQQSMHLPGFQIKLIVERRQKCLERKTSWCMLGSKEVVIHIEMCISCE